MAILEVLTFPDPRLRKLSAPISDVNAEVASYANDMLETMRDFHGIGLAAPQVNRLERLMVIDTRPKDDNGRYNLENLTELEKAVTQPLIIINPKITKQEGKTTYDEGCLSVPSYFETVERFEYIELSYLNEKGEQCSLKTDGLLSICIQHEIDHLDGKLFIDRLSTIKSNRVKAKIKKHGYPTKEEMRSSLDSGEA